MTRSTRIVCAYVMTHDSGHAPNPFHNVCTLAICTPNHQCSTAEAGDWIVGLTGDPLRRELGSPGVWRLLYAMHVDTKLDLDSYYKAPRFRAKRPRGGGSLIEERGDNFYCKDASGRLHHTGETDEHRDDESEEKDIRGNRVFAAERFWYFGRNAVALPQGVQWAKKLVARFESVAVGVRNAYDRGREVDVRWSASDLSEFTAWLPEEGGLLGFPIHWGDASEGESCASSCGSNSNGPCGGAKEPRGQPPLPKSRIC